MLDISCVLHGNFPNALNINKPYLQCITTDFITGTLMEYTKLKVIWKCGPFLPFLSCTFRPSDSFLELEGALVIMRSNHLLLQRSKLQFREALPHPRPHHKFRENRNERTGLFRHETDMHGTTRVMIRG